MRLSAKEARNKANIKISPESIANAIFNLILLYSETGVKELTITHGFPSQDFTPAMIVELFKFGDTYKYIEDLLVSLGYKIDIGESHTFININWG